MKNNSLILSVKTGISRGIETYNFVRDIVSRYESYKKKIKA